MRRWQALDATRWRRSAHLGRAVGALGTLASLLVACAAMQSAVSAAFASPRWPSVRSPHTSASTGPGSHARQLALRAEAGGGGVAQARPPTTGEDGYKSTAGRTFGDIVADVRKNGKARTNTPEWAESWTDYTRKALGVEEQLKAGEVSIESGEEGNRFREFTDRKRTLGIDFGPSFTGVALSLGGVNSMPVGTYVTGTDWKETALKIVQTASTRRVRDIVVGLPLEKDGEDGQVAGLVRHFSQLLADTTLLLLGGNVSVYLWDERFSTTYAAMRLVTRPRFKSGAFKNWLDGQRGLDFSDKAMLDSEAARAILEHFLEKDPATEKLNKERADRVNPSRQACKKYLEWKKRPLIEMKRPKEPPGMWAEAVQYDEWTEGAEDVSPELYESQLQSYSRSMKGMGSFASPKLERKEERQERHSQWLDKRKLGRLQDDSVQKATFIAAAEDSGAKVASRYKGLATDRKR